ncbi:MAG: hypothetical protein M0Z31_14325 [Clostridia bacterium]|nr:hypothetical protein [Clostridia bacterium]
MSRKPLQTAQEKLLYLGSIYGMENVVEILESRLHRSVGNNNMFNNKNKIHRVK